jgi:hypothetical protein
METTVLSRGSDAVRTTETWLVGRLVSNELKNVEEVVVALLEVYRNFS